MPRKSQKRWKCKECHRQFSVKFGTIFEDSPIALDKWLTALQTGSLTKLGGSGTPVEVDETFIGGKARFMHRDKRERMSSRGGMQGGHGKAIVMGLLERGGKVKASVIPHRKESIPEMIVREMVEPGAEVHTDEFTGYYNLKDGFTHKVINHLEGYVKENVHTNGIENFWSCLKRGISGTLRCG
jgi:hypothetical protein